MIQQYSPGRPEPADEPPGAGHDHHGRMMLVAVRPDREPAVSFGSALFQRIRVVVVPDDGDGLDDIRWSHVLGELPRLRAHAGRDASPWNALRHSRPLRGEILCDAAGRLYERRGHCIQPVHQLVAGPHGEVLDITPPAARRRRRETEPADNDTDNELIAGEVVVNARPLEAAPAAPAFRELAPVPQPRIVRFGEFKNVLGPQLLHPERLRDTHRLSCRPRIYEATLTQPLEALSSSVFEGAGGTLLPLTPQLAATLGIARPAPAAMHSRTPGTIAAGERVVRLEVVDDPTAGMPSAPPEAAMAGAATPSGLSAATYPGVHTAKTTIPDRYIGPWPFTVTREQAVCDLNDDRGRSAVRRALDRLRSAATSGRDRRKWRALLHGKSLDEQLWTVPPPRGGLGAGAVHDWARRTLAAAGYDAAVMLLEWEIFWRRKGL